jgi:hypothetical protein
MRTFWNGGGDGDGDGEDDDDDSEVVDIDAVDVDPLSLCWCTEEPVENDAVCWKNLLDTDCCDCCCCDCWIKSTSLTPVGQCFGPYFVWYVCKVRRKYVLEHSRAVAIVKKEPSKANRSHTRYTKSQSLQSLFTCWYTVVFKEVLGYNGCKDGDAKARRSSMRG